MKCDRATPLNISEAAYLVHMWERMLRCRINPQLNAYFADEDFIRVMCGIAA